MTKADRIIAGLVDALDAIARTTQTTEPNSGATNYIRGIAEQAMANANIQRVRNSDGYLVVKE